VLLLAQSECRWAIRQRGARLGVCAPLFLFFSLGKTSRQHVGVRSRLGLNIQETQMSQSSCRFPQSDGNSTRLNVDQSGFTSCLKKSELEPGGDEFKVHEATRSIYLVWEM